MIVNVLLNTNDQLPLIQLFTYNSIHSTQFSNIVYTDTLNYQITKILTNYLYSLNSYKDFNLVFEIAERGRYTQTAQYDYIHDSFELTQILRNINFNVCLKQSKSIFLVPFEQYPIFKHIKHSKDFVEIDFKNRKLICKHYSDCITNPINQERLLLQYPYCLRTEFVFIDGKIIKTRDFNLSFDKLFKTDGFEMTADIVYNLNTIGFEPLYTHSCHNKYYFYNLKSQSYITVINDLAITNDKIVYQLLLCGMV